MVKYYMPVYDGSNIVSCDMLRIEFEVSKNNLEAFQSAMQGKLNQYNCLCEYYSSFRDFQYRHLFRFGLKGCSFVVGFSFNGTKSEQNRKGFIEFNPNKVLSTVVLDDGVIDVDGFLKLRRNDSCPFYNCEDETSTFDMVRDCFVDVFNFILNNFAIHKKIKRFDIAIDIAVSRDSVQLLKDKRKYTQFMNSKFDFTEYLGSGSSGGRVKVYNKTIESMLDYDLTRIEVTSDELDYFNFMKYFPQIRVADKSFSSATTVFLEMLELIPVQERNRIYVKLDPKTKKKYREMLEGQYVDLSRKVYDKIVDGMQNLVDKGITFY